ncbi:MAG TPA: cytochrome c biogenesis protein ResB [Candidatus Limnocylindrales bacterium]|nr:cytochrome c biogenesis protein ResB [Candidatus Limnocylindrales bacterium]
MSALTAGRPGAARSAERPGSGFGARLDRLWLGVWRLFTSVNFAVLQIIVLALLAVVGMTIRQLPGFAFRSAGDYAAAMADIHARYDAVLGAGIVDAMERLQLFHVFSSTWFTIGLIVLVVSIVICTIDRTPRLWRTSAEIRVVQPDAYFDPKLPDRVRIAAPDPAGPVGAGGLDAGAVRRILRRHRFAVRTAEVDAVTYLYGDRNRWTKLATLVSHLGLILFLIAAAVTSRLGDEQGLVVAEGDTLTVQPIGTPGLLLVRNNGFEAPGLFENGVASDFVTDLSVYRDGELLARKAIRVNDPLAAGGYTFHQNGFGPAPNLRLRDLDGGILWSAPVPLTDQAGGLPFGTLAVPGRELGLQLLLDRTSAGVGTLLVLPYVVVGTNPDGTPAIETGFPLTVTNGATATFEALDLSVTLDGFSEYTLLIAKKDPGQGIVWTAFASLIVGLSITFYLPRRRVWARLDRAGELSLVGRSDRYVDFDREFGRLVDDLVTARGAAGGTPRAGHRA